MNEPNLMIKTRRRFQRVIFTREDGVICIFKPLSDTKNAGVNAASILNLSASGLQFIVDKEDANRFHKGQMLVFKGIRGVKQIDFMEDIEMEIIWILQLKFLKNIGIGCEFKHISNRFRDHIDNFVTSEIQFRGQNIYRTAI